MEKELKHNVDYYQLLGIDRKASLSEVKKAYRELAKKYHPDLNNDPKASNVFQNIQSAYEVLADPRKRKIYDYLLFRKEKRQFQGQFHNTFQKEEERAKQEQAYQRAKEQVKKERYQLNTPAEFLQFNLKQTVGLAITGIVLIAGMLLTGVGINFLFVKAFNGSLVAGYFTCGFGLLLIYKMISAIKTLFHIWETGIRDYYSRQKTDSSQNKN